MKINDKYEVKAVDEKNIILIEKLTYEKGKNQGEEYEKTLGYYPNVKAALKGLAKREILGDGLEDIQRVSAKIDLLYAWIDKAINE